MRRWRDIGEGDRQKLARIFERSAVLDELLEVAGTADEDDTREAAVPRARPSCSLETLHRIASDPDYIPSAQTLGEIAQSPRLRQDLNALLRQYALDRFQPLAAAATEALEVDRFARDFVVRLRSTARSKSEVYLILERREAAAGPGPRKLIVRRPGGQVAILTLAAGEVFPVQRILPADDAVVQGILDGDATLDIV